MWNKIYDLGANNVKYSKNISALSRPRDLMCSNMKNDGEGFVARHSTGGDICIIHYWLLIKMMTQLMVIIPVTTNVTHRTG